MTIFQKSIHKELLRNFGGSTVILFTIVMTIMLIRILGQASKGQADPSEVILLIALNGIGNAAPILTLSMFVSIVYTFSRMYLDSEMIIWFSSGLSLSKFLKPLWQFCWPVILVIALLAVFAWPWSNTQTQYLKDRFEKFGIYEDAIVTKQTVLHHSVLSPMLNIGLIAPQQIIDRAIAFSNKNKIPLNSLEGFIRQIMGWREFIRIVYEREGSKQRTTNYWKFTRKIPASFWSWA